MATAPLHYERNFQAQMAAALLPYPFQNVLTKESAAKVALGLFRDPRLFTLLAYMKRPNCSLPAAKKIEWFTQLDALPRKLHLEFNGNCSAEKVNSAPFLEVLTQKISQSLDCFASIIHPEEPLSPEETEQVEQTKKQIDEMNQALAKGCSDRDIYEMHKSLDALVPQRAIFVT